MLDMTPIDNEETSASGGNEVPCSKAELEGIFGTKGKGYVECLNSSFGSIEGFGEGGESESQEVSLELQVAGLQHQVSPVGIPIFSISSPRSSDSVWTGQSWNSLLPSVRNRLLH